jgi:hypothetical protein
MLICMRTTLNIDDALMRKVKRLASRQGKTMTQVVQEALRKEVTGERPSHGRFRLEWVTVSGRLLPGVDLSDRESLLDAMEGRS